MASLEPNNSQYKMTYSNIPRASIHVGSNKKAFSRRWATKRNAEVGTRNVTD
ncbi:hypothetical protein [Prevotella sp.]|uniref:hypothetical protein n=1 Tax=uncultured Prevotella sp. TaxID=159272 RepID=UPI0027E327B6|nr:hypothetical protein [Prevotella sp.]